MIFQQTLPSQGNGLPFNGYEVPQLGMELSSRVTLTHVCRRWRRVALDMASLWTVIDEFSSASSSVLLARSRQMPVQVYIKNMLSRSTGNALVAHGHRIRDLYLSIPKEHRSAIPSSVPEFPFDAMNLERLSITTDARPFDESRPIVNLDLSPALFGQPTPRLRMLVLRNMCWLPDISYGNLTHLHITQGTPVSLVTVLTFLGRCTALEELILVDIYIASSAAVPLDHAVTLPRLRTLVLGINQSHLSMRRLIQYLILPPTATVRVTGVYAFRALSDLRPFPHLPFTETFDTLSVDHSFGHLVVRASGPSSALFLDFKDYPLSSSEQAIYLMQSIIPFGNILDIRYRAHVHHARRAVHLLGDSHMPSLKKFCYIDTHDASTIPDAWADRREAYMNAISQALERAPQLSNLELWSVDDDFPSRLTLSDCASLKELVFHYTGKPEVVPDMTTTRERVANARLCSCTCELPLRIPSADFVDHPYEW